MRNADRGGLLDKVLDKASTILEVGGNAAEVLIHLQNPTPIGLVAAGFKVLHEIREVRSVDASEYFSHGWVRMMVGTMIDFFHDACCHAQPVEYVAGTNRFDPAAVHEIFGIMIGWEFEDEACKNPSTLWVKGDDYTDAFPALGRAAWEFLKTQKAVVSQDSSTNRQGRRVDLVAERADDVFPSKVGEDLLERVRSFNAEGINRSIFLLGPPGTGKSSLMRFIAERFGGFCLRVKLEDLRTLRPKTIVRIVEILRPSVLLIDDIDRHTSSSEETGPANLLDALESVNANVKLFIVSANHADHLAAAILRPGRFDELIEIDTLDDEIVERMLDGCDRETIDRIGKLPIAYIAEISKRIKVLGVEEAVKEIDDLFKRDAALRERLDKYGSAGLPVEERRRGMIGRVQ